MIPMKLYANAFHVDAGRCFRFVYEPSTSRPMACPGPVVTRGWWNDGAGYWWAVATQLTAVRATTPHTMSVTSSARVRCSTVMLLNLPDTVVVGHRSYPFDWPAEVA